MALTFSAGVTTPQITAMQKAPAIATPTQNITFNTFISPPGTRDLIRFVLELEHHKYFGSTRQKE
jgi:hypothetical protein